MEYSMVQSLKLWNVSKTYYLLHLSHVGGRMGQVFGRVRWGLVGGFFCGASKKFGVECECRRSLKAHLRGHGGPLGALRVNLDALMGHCMAQVLVFLKDFLGFLLSRASLMRMWGRRIEFMIRVLIFKCVDAGLKF